MAREGFIDWRPQTKSEYLLNKANGICADLAARGYELTLRQLYYQMVSKDIIPNNQLSYDRLGELINNGRLAGVFDWRFISDRTRMLRGNRHQRTVASALNALAENYRLDKWVGQPRRVEVWVEKDALVDVIGGASSKLDVDFFSCRGYTSQSAMYSAGKRHLRYEAEHDLPTLVLHLGDHDPSGLDMTRDITERLELFGTATEVRRIALNMDQIEAYNPPPNPAKLTDSRSKAYVEEYGPSSWELDALDPEVLEALITSEVTAIIDAETMEDVRMREVADRELLVAVAEHEDVIRGLAPDFELPDVEALEGTISGLSDNLATELEEKRVREERSAMWRSKWQVFVDKVAASPVDAPKLHEFEDVFDWAGAVFDELNAPKPSPAATDIEEWGDRLRAILDEVGDTTRAKSLKDRIRKALGDE